MAIIMILMDRHPAEDITLIYYAKILTKSVSLNFANSRQRSKINFSFLIS
jgi:hypothetical protein